MIGEEYQELFEGAQAGDAHCQLQWAARLATGDGVEKNLEEAIKWYRLAADQEEHDGYYNLALMYLFGEGVEQSQAEAVSLLGKAAILGSTSAHMILGDAYLYGQLDFGIDSEKAAEHYLNAFYFRDIRGIQCVGKLLSDGRVSREFLAELMQGFAV